MPKRRTSSRTALDTIAVLLCGLSAGCGLLDTRDPEPPRVIIEIPYETPDEPIVVLRNIEATLEAKSTINYETSLTEDFTFLPTDADAQDFQANLPWTKAKEVAATDAFLNDFLSENGVVTLTWTVPANFLEAGQSPQGERQVYYQDLGYRLEFQLGGASRVYSGECDLYFRESGVGNLWAIYDWQDKEDGSSNASWGRLRIDKRVVFL